MVWEDMDHTQDILQLELLGVAVVALVEVGEVIPTGVVAEDPVVVAVATHMVEVVAAVVLAEAEEVTLMEVVAEDPVAVVAVTLLDMGTQVDYLEEDSSTKPT
jgi:hypothetical protein